MEWIKKEPVAFLLGLLVMVIGAREYFRAPVSVPVSVSDAKPQRIVIETTGGTATTDDDGTVRIKVDTPAHIVAENPVGITQSLPEPVVSEAPEVNVASSKDAAEAVKRADDAKADSSDGAKSNTAGGFREAPMIDKTTADEILPEEARKLAEELLHRIPPVLESLRESGRLNWKIGELEDDVLVLNRKQEMFLLEVGDEVQDYLTEVKGFHGEIADRAVGVRNSAIFDYMLSGLRKGELIHPQLRRNFITILQQLNVPALSGFYAVDDVNALSHPLWGGRIRLVSMDLRRSDLFFLIAAYRLANEDYANILNLEARVDEIMSYIDMKEFVKGEEHFIEYVDTEGVQRQFRTEGQFYMPRQHQKDFQRMFLGEDPTNFITTEEFAQDRDTMKARREQLGEKIKGVVEILGEEWAQYDFPLAEISGEDTYYRAKVLQEELTYRTASGDLKIFREFMQRLSAAKTTDEAQLIAEEALPTNDAEHVANYIISSSSSLYNKPYSGPDKDFKVEDLTQSLRAIYAALSGTGIRSLLNDPPPEDLAKAVQLISKGEHYAASGQDEAAIDCFKEAASTTQLSEGRLKHFAEYCEKKGHSEDAKKFWTKPESDAK